jgi:gas vesicle protein
MIRRLTMLALVTKIRMQHARTTATDREVGAQNRTGVGLRVAGAALLGAALLAVGCGEQTPSEGRVSANDLKQQTEEALDVTAQLAQQEKNDFQQAAQQELDDIKAELDALKHEAQSARGAAKQALQKQVQLLEEKWRAAEATLTALRMESAQTWAGMKEQVLAALADLRQSYQELRREMAQS